jgi:DNA polymerase-1
LEDRDKRTVYLVDGSSYLHRAYHAIRNLSNSRGFPTNAVFGFTQMILKLLKDKDPQYLAVVFDAKGPTFRHRIYASYKANRPPMPEDLAVQIPVIKTVCEGLRLPIFEMEGYEADDIMGTLARLSEEKGLPVVLVTGDKDFRQLVGPKVSMWDTMKDVETRYETLKREFGFEPARFIDVMGLSGDTSDNIPGVPGVGEKTAVDLVKSYGSMEDVLDKAGEVPRKKLGEKLRSFRDQALLSKKLVTIDRYVPLGDPIERLRVGAPDGERLAAVFRELEFRDLWRRFASREEGGARTYRLCETPEALRALIEEIQKAGKVCLDTETTSADPLSAQLVGISFCHEEKRATYLPLGHAYPGVPSQMPWSEAGPMLRSVLEDQRILKIGQNIKYDAQVLRSHGVELRGIHFDTMVASYLLQPGLRQHNLGHLAQHYLDHKMASYSDVVGEAGSKDFSGVDIEKARDYSCEDADIAFRLARVLGESLREVGNEALFYDLEMRLLPVLVDMEWAGIRIDSKFFEEMSATFAAQMERLEKEIYGEAGIAFNISSPKQLGFVLFEKLGLPADKKTMKTRGYSTDVKVLKRLSASAFKLPALVLRYRSLSKLKSTYLDALVKMMHPRTGRVHTSFNQTVTATGRLSSSNPNLQNIPARGEEGREIRKGFVAEEGHLLISADYSQVELRVFAHYGRDEAFMEAFRRDEDIHARTASEILGVPPAAVTAGMRRIAKAINFGILYGMGPQKLSEELGIPLAEAKAYIKTYLDRYRGVSRYKEEMIETARRQGYVTTLLHRRRYLPDILHPNRAVRAEAERMAVNTPIQGTAADLIKMAMIRIHERMRKEGFRAKMLLQVHDELLFELPEAEAERLIPLIRSEMEGVYELLVPLKVDIGKGRNWDEAH